MIVLSSWYPARSAKGKLLIEMLPHLKCPKCGNSPPFETAIGNHAIPYGRGGDVWCGEVCFGGKPDE